MRNEVRTLPYSTRSFSIWWGLALAGGSIASAAFLYRHPVTAALLCLLAISIFAQILGSLRAFILSCFLSGMLLLWVFPATSSLRAPLATGAFFFVASVLCALEGRLPAAQRRESRALTLVRFTRDLNAADTEAEVKMVLEDYLEQHFGAHETCWSAGLEEGDSAGGSSSHQTLTDGRMVNFPEGQGWVKFAAPPDERQFLELFLTYSSQTLQHHAFQKRLRDAEILAATEKLQRALLNSISHDLRSPLVSITGALSGLLSSELGELEESHRDLLENALAEAERLNRLVENLLQMTRLEAGTLRLTKKPYDIVEVATVVLDTIALRDPSRRIELLAANDLPMVPMDPHLVGQILMNLLDNALKYSPKDETVTVEIQHERQALELAVSDRGVGVPADEVGRVFEKFFRGKGHRARGTGLGLSICEGLVSAHGGKIWLESGPNGETVFKFSLPLDRQDTSQHTQQDRKSKNV